tara:strand:- start:3180 stop:3374 length:195 start_codon:yes stop_codon:yes gene_type:complete
MASPRLRKLRRAARLGAAVPATQPKEKIVEVSPVEAVSEAVPAKAAHAKKESVVKGSASAKKVH